MQVITILVKALSLIGDNKNLIYHQKIAVDLDDNSLEFFLLSKFLYKLLTEHECRGNL